MIVPRLVATDVDGTLLRPDESVSERTRRVLRDIQAGGVTVVLVTGRPPRWVRVVADASGVWGPAICANGAVLYDVIADRLLDHRPLTPEVMVDLVVGLRRLVPGVTFAFELGLAYAREPAYRPGRSISDCWIVEDALTLASRPVTKLLAKHPTLDAEGLTGPARQIARDRAAVTYSTTRLLEISAAGVTKAAALARLCRRRGLEASEVVAFGDMPNDVDMLRWSGWGVAVSNAAPEVLAAADEVAPTNAEDGVAQVLERLLSRS